MTTPLSQQLAKPKTAFGCFHALLRARPWVAVIILIAVGLLVRFACSGMRVFVFPDSMAYWFTMKALLAGEWQNTYVERTPLYPLFLMLIQGLSTLLQPLSGQMDMQILFQRVLLVIQSLFGILNACLVMQLLRHLLGNTVTAFYAALALVCLPDLLLYEHAFLTETLYTTGLLVWLIVFVNCHKQSEHMAVERKADGRCLTSVVLLGFVTAIVMLLKPIAASLALCGLVWLFRVPLLQAARIKALFAFIFPMLLCLTPWMLFNANVHGTFTLAAGRGANQLYKMIDDVDWYSPLAGEYKIQLHQRYLVHPEGETYNAVNDVHVLMDQAAKRQPNYSAIYLRHDEQAGLLAWEAILAHPFQWVMQTAKQFLDFFFKAPVPLEKLPLFVLISTVSFQVWQVLLLLSVLGTLLACQRRQVVLMMGAGVIVSHAVLYAVTTLADARYHIPLEPFALILSAYLIHDLLAARSLTSDPAADPRSAFLPVV